MRITLQFYAKTSEVSRLFWGHDIWPVGLHIDEAGEDGHDGHDGHGRGRDDAHDHDGDDGVRVLRFRYAGAHMPQVPQSGMRQWYNVSFFVENKIKMKNFLISI